MLKAKRQYCKICPRRNANLNGPCIGLAVTTGGYCQAVGIGYKWAVSACLAWSPCSEFLDFKPNKSISNLKQPTSNETLILIGRVKKCNAWQRSIKCGCGKNRCLAGKGQQGIVTHNDCFACLREKDAQTATEVDRQSPETSGS